MGKLKDLTGYRVGRLTVIERKGSDKNKKALWLCRCECGNEKIISSNRLLNKKPTLSCGCLAKEILIKRNTTHGLTKKQARLYNTWGGMKERCFNNLATEYKNYGARGISVCDEWKNNFVKFYEWAMENGYKDNLTIERIDVNKGYEPSNCTWITKAEQAFNKRNSRLISFKGENKALQYWCNKYNLNRGMVRTRLKLGWDVEKAFFEPSIKGRNQYYKKEKEQ